MGDACVGRPTIHTFDAEVRKHGILLLVAILPRFFSGSRQTSNMANGAVARRPVALTFGFFKYPAKFRCCFGVNTFFGSSFGNLNRMLPTVFAGKSIHKLSKRDGESSTRRWPVM